MHFECGFHFSRCNLQQKRAARTCRLFAVFECASVTALLKRTARITQAGLGDQTLRTGTVAFSHCVALSKSRIFLHHLKAIAVKFLVWENTLRKELHPLELTSKVTTEFAYNSTSRNQ